MKKLLMFFVFGITTFMHAHPDPLDLVLNPNEKILKNLDLRGADLANKNLTLKTFISIDFRGANLSNSFFIGCYFIDCIFVDAYVNNTIFQKAHFIGCNLLNMRGITKSNFVLDPISKLTFFGNEDATLYPQSGKFYQIGSQKIIVSGLCRQIYDEAQKAIKNDD